MIGTKLSINIHDLLSHYLHSHASHNIILGMGNQYIEWVLQLTGSFLLE